MMGRYCSSTLWLKRSTLWTNPLAQAPTLWTSDT
jgi:hypothetical protein